VGDLFYRSTDLSRPGKNMIADAGLTGFNAPDVRSRPQQTLLADSLELSIVIPCLNEADTVGTCIEKALGWIRQSGINAEIILADNGSTDGSPRIAAAAGAKTFSVPEPGYGSALMGGISQARGRYIIMGDADNSYDFSALDGFLEKLRAGFDLVQGCRLASGGGHVVPQAMPWLHRWIGNPFFSFLARTWFGAPIHDVNCGLRGFSAAFYRTLNLRCTGMEFAVEMVIKACMSGARIAEVPITLHPDGRINRRPHLRTFRDGWRTLRFFLMFSPRWLFVVPGLFLIAIGLVTYAVLLPGTFFIGRVGLDIHTLLFASALIIVGFDAVALALFTRVFAASAKLMPAKSVFNRLNEQLSLEIGLIGSSLLLLAGFGLAAFAFFRWQSRNFGALDARVFVRLVVSSTTLLILGSQMAFGTFFLSILNLQRRL
jgi:glycosyltransferase involved in cell wall biosynthesis